MCGLMHDAHEAFTGDVISPIKDVLNALGDGCWKRWETQVQAQVLERFELTEHWRDWPAEVHRADRIILATEARDLMPPHDRLARDLREIPTSRELVLDAPRYHQATWQQVRDEFLDRFAELRERMQEHVALQADTPAEA
jgi:5'-deoxynucleotidase YfbR-like HD superfamily hydrolase